MLVLAAAFGVFACAQAALVIGLATRRPRWRALAGCLVPPLAAYWGWEAKLRVRSVIWLFALVIYGLAVLSASVS